MTEPAAEPIAHEEVASAPEPYVIEGRPSNPAADWAIVEIFGHRRYVGAIMEIERFGTKMMRVDIPKQAEDGQASFDNGYASIFYAGGSIFSITPTDFATVLMSNRGYPRPAVSALPPPRRDGIFGDLDDGESEAGVIGEDEDHRNDDPAGGSSADQPPVPGDDRHAE